MSLTSSNPAPRGLVRRLKGELMAIDKVDLISRLTLLTLLLQPVGFWGVRPILLAVSVIGLLSTTARQHWGLWATLTVLTGARIVEDWPMSDNHAYLLVYWCLALTIGFYRAEPEIVGRLNARWMLGLLFTFAVLWKGLLSPDYVDGTFFRVIFLTDERFADAAQLFGDMTLDDLDLAYQSLSQPLPPGAELVEPPPIPESAALHRLAILSTWVTLVLEALVALAFLLPSSLRPLGWLHRYRDFVLVAFCTITYPIAPVVGFGWLLLTMGIAQARDERRLLYLATFLLLIFYRGVPWASLLVERLG
ncbi:MAG: hypothetical protein AAGD38_18935 [Acidobacteriota bacterium]